jgi:hypothetical protein
VGVRLGLQRDQQGRFHLEHSNIRHQPDIRRDIVASRGDPLSLHPNDRCLSRHLIGDHNINSSIARSNNSLGLFSRTDQGSRPVGPSSTSGTRTTGPKKGCWMCGEPHYQRDCPVERTRASRSAGPTTMGDMGKAHRIHAVVNNHQAEH